MTTGLLAKMALTGLLVAAGVWDLKTRRVPHVITWPLLLAATGFRIAHPEGLWWTASPAGFGARPWGQGGFPLLGGGWALIILLIGVVLVERIPPLWRLPTMASLVTGVQLGSRSLNGNPAIGFTALWWGIAYGLWSLHVLGGADIRILMALVALFPRPELVAALSGGLLLASLAWLILVRRQGALVSLLETGHKLMRGRFPSRDELEAHGRPTTPGLALGGIVFLWLIS
jgi:Flp pilus assembly protein protease CpaA